MWALRRASKPLKNQAVCLVSRFSCGKLEISSNCVGKKPCMVECPHEVCDNLAVKRFHSGTTVLSKFTVSARDFSSQAGAESSGDEDNFEDGFSELGVEASTELVSETEDSDDDDVDEPSQNESERDIAEKKSLEKQAHLKLFKAVAAAPVLSINITLDKWFEGKDLDRVEISLAILHLRKRKWYRKALQVSEWLHSHEQVDLVEQDYSSRLDLISKVHGLQKAEQYIEKIPKSFRGEVVYRTFLANCVMTNNVKKAEGTFNKMKDLEFPVTSFACNQLLLLYKRTDKKKIADVLLLMEKENVKPTLFTYKILIDTKGLSNDMTAMDQVVETMKAESIEPDLSTQAMLARHYVNGGMKEKAEAVIKEMEGSNLKGNRSACHFLLPLFAALGKVEEVERVWKICGSNPWLEECTAAIEAWGKLKRIEEAEAVFDRMLKTWRLSAKHWYALLKVYTDHKMLAKGKDHVKRMGENGCKIGPLTWDALVKLYIEAGEVEKADSILQKAVNQSQMKPMFSSYLVLMDRYAKRGDIHNSEKIFHRMRQAGYVARLRQFQSLIEAYVSAKTPAYGIRERMKADNIFPNKSMAEQLVKVDAFRKTAVSELLD